MSLSSEETMITISAISNGFYIISNCLANFVMQRVFIKVVSHVCVAAVQNR